MAERSVVEEELMIEVERLKAWIGKIRVEAYKETKLAVIEWLAEQAIIHSHCATHPQWRVNEDWAKLGSWPPATIVDKDRVVAGQSK